MPFCHTMAGVNVITPRKLREFWQEHPQAERPLRAWEKLIRKAAPAHFDELAQVFGSVDFVPPEYTVFDIGGNKYRLVTFVAYKAQRVYIKHVLTHREYDLWTEQNRKGGKR